MNKLTSPSGLLRSSMLKGFSAAMFAAALGTTTLVADVVYVTALPPNCTTTSTCGVVNTDGTYNEISITMGNTGVHGTAAGRPPTPTSSRAYLSGTTYAGTGGVDIKPVLGINNTVYQIDYNWNSSAGNSTLDAVFNMTCTGGTLSTNSTPLFQRVFGVSANWDFMGYITNSSTTPTISFRYASGTINASSQSRLLWDCWRFTAVTPCLSVAPVGVDGPLSADNPNVVVTGVSASATKLTLYQNAGSGFTNIGSLNVSSPAATVTVPVTGTLVKGAQVGATQTVGGQEGCVPGAGTIVGGGANPRIRLAASIRQPGLSTSGAVNGPIGANGGGPAADLYWIHATGFPVVGGIVLQPSTNWQTVAFYPWDQKYLWNNNADGFSFPDPFQFGIFEGFGIAIDDLTDTGPMNVYIDNLRNGTTMIQSFENQTAGTQLLFRQPSFSGTTSGNILADPNLSQVSENNAGSGTNAAQIRWQWPSLSSQNWLRLNSSATGGGAGATPNPEVDLTQPILADILILPPGQSTGHSMGVISPIPPYSQTVCVGDNASFYVTVAAPTDSFGNPLPRSYTYQWQMNGTSVAGATASKFTTNNVTADAGGTYSVAISDGPATNSISYLLTVNASGCPTPVSTLVASVGPSASVNIDYTGGSGNQFVLLCTNNLSAPPGLWARVATNSTTPGTFNITPATAPAQYYRVKSE